MDHLSLGNKNHLETILNVLQKITESQQDLKKDNELLKKKLDEYENINNYITKTTTYVSLNDEICTLDYCQDYIKMLSSVTEVYSTNIVTFITECVSSNSVDTNISSLVRLFGIIYLPENRSKDWNVQLSDRRKHMFSYADKDGNNMVDYSGKGIFNIFISNYEIALRGVINLEIEDTISSIENGETDADEAYSMLMRTHNMRKYYSNLIKVKQSSETFIKKLIRMYF
jgi:hypothetical protein|uniref:Uncharacterized protein n=1 Tax=viral metagenome TaxID=1070528 RepID=A0A6C0J3T4_9ZZZZ